MLGAWVPEQTFWIDVSKSCSATDPFYSIIFTLENLEFFPNSCCEKPNVYLCKGNEKVKWTCGPLPPSCGRHWNSMLKDLKDLTVGKFLWLVIETGIWRIFWNLSYGSSMDHSKDNIRNNFLILKPTISFFLDNYFFFKLIFKNNYIWPFLITTFILQLTHSFSLFTRMDMKKQINICLFMSMKCILFIIKFDTDINNNELLKTIWKHKEKIK